MVPPLGDRGLERAIVIIWKYIKYKLLIFRMRLTLPLAGGFAQRPLGGFKIFK
jgi:hypothetical protein